LQTQSKMFTFLGRGSVCTTHIISRFHLVWKSTPRAFCEKICRTNSRGAQAYPGGTSQVNLKAVCTSNGKRTRRSGQGKRTHKKRLAPAIFLGDASDHPIHCWTVQPTSVSLALLKSPSVQSWLSSRAPSAPTHLRSRRTRCGFVLLRAVQAACKVGLAASPPGTMSVTRSPEHLQPQVCNAPFWLWRPLSPLGPSQHFLVGLGISRTSADSQWDSVYKAIHRIYYRVVLETKRFVSSNVNFWRGKPAASARARRQTPSAGILFFHTNLEYVMRIKI